MIICLLCPLLCGLFFFWKGAKGELSYKVKKMCIFKQLQGQLQLVVINQENYINFFKLFPFATCTLDVYDKT